MSRTIRNYKSGMFQYWKSRYKKFVSEWNPGRFTKKLTHKFERRTGKAIAENDLEQTEKGPIIPHWDYRND